MQEGQQHACMDATIPPEKTLHGTHDVLTWSCQLPLASLLHVTGSLLATTTRRSSRSGVSGSIPGSKYVSSPASAKSNSWWLRFLLRRSFNNRSTLDDDSCLSDPSERGSVLPPLLGIILDRMQRYFG